VLAPGQVDRELAVELAAAGFANHEIEDCLGVNKTTFWRWRKTDPEFAVRIADARTVGRKERVRQLKSEAERRALRGSDKLLMFLLCNYAPDEFSNTQRLEHTDKTGMVQEILAARRRAGQAPAAAEPEPGADLC
jgi:hypothetical protein